MAGKTVIIERKATRMAVAETNPNSRMPWKSVSISTDEGARRGEGAEQHPRPRPLACPADGGGRERPSAELLLVPEEEVDAVVGPDAYDDRDEHDREDAEMTDHERDDPERPGHAHRQRDQDEQRRGDSAGTRRP